MKKFQYKEINRSTDTALFIVYAPARRLRFEIDLLTSQLIHRSTTATARLSLVA